MLPAVSKTFAPILRISSKNLTLNVAKMSSKTGFETVAVTVPHEFVYHVELNRPDKLNALNKKMWKELHTCVQELDQDENCRVIILSAAGRLFTAGLDLGEIMKTAPQLAAAGDVARKAKIFYAAVTSYQKTISSLELCKKPVLAAIHSGCIGAGFNMITATDIRYCTKDAFFALKEVDIGMAADVGALQRLPKIIGSDSLVRELSYTGRNLGSDEALSSGLVSRVFENKEKMLEGVLKVANEIAQKSPVAVQTTKNNLVFSRDHTVQEGLEHIILLNQLMLQSEDFINGAMGQIQKQQVKFAKL